MLPQLKQGASHLAALSSECDEVGRLALGSTPVHLREVFAVALALDTRLARLVSLAREPMLAQLRLAWWRDRLQEPEDVRPRGDPVLDAVSTHWRGIESALQKLVDAWEHLLGDDPPPDRARALGTGRGAVFAALADYAGAAGSAGQASAHGEVWAIATVQQEAGVALADIVPPLAPLPRSLRGLALIGGLSKRAVLRGDGVLLGDRLSPLAAARIALLGR